MSRNPGDWWDRTWGVVEGCTPVGPACDRCWARAMIRRFDKGDPSEVVLFLERLDLPDETNKPTRWFVASRGDLFHQQVTEAFRRMCFEVMRENPRHNFYVLTKRYEALAAHARHPETDHIHLGFTAWDQASLDAAVKALRSTSVPLWVSLEPLLGPVYFSLAFPMVDWVVCGGETGPGARPMHVEWVRSIQDQCENARVPFWFKSWGSAEPKSEQALAHPLRRTRRLDRCEYSERPEEW